MPNNLGIGVDFTGDVSGLKAAAAQGAAALNGFAGAAGKAGKEASQAFDEVAAGAAAMKRIAASIDEAAAAFLNIGSEAASGTNKAIKSIAELEAELDRLHEEIRQATNFSDITRLGVEFKKVQQQLNNTKVLGLEQSLAGINRNAAGAGRGLGQVKSSAQAALPVVTDFGRILQDIPFGFVGISNNIPVLQESFQRLKQSTGSTGGAFKALFASLGGAGGFGLVLSAVTSAVTLATIGFGAWTRGMGGSAGAAKKAKDETDEFDKVLKSIGDELGRDAARATTFFNALTSGTLNTGQRKKALQELKGINEEFFGALKDEKGVIEGLQVAYDGYLSKLLQIGKAKAIEAQLTRLFDKRIELELSIDPKFIAATTPAIQRNIAKLADELKQLGGPIEDQAKAFDDIIKAQIKSGEISKPGESSSNKIAANLERRLAIQRQITVLEQGSAFFQDKTFNQAKAQISKIDLQIKGLSQQQKDLGVFDISATKDTGSKKEDAILKALKDELQGLQKNLKDTNELREAGLLPLNRENDALDLQLKILKLLGQIDAREVEIKAKPKLEIDPAIADLEIKKALTEFGKRSISKVSIPVQFDIRPVGSGNLFSPADIIAPDGIDPKAFDPMIDAIKQQATDASVRAKKVIKENFIDSLSKTFEQGIFDSFDQLGKTFGDIISGGEIGEALASAAQSFLGIIGGVIQEVGKQIAEISELLLLTQRIVTNLFKNPAAGIGIGLALVALGGLLKNIKISGFADGGTIPNSGIFDVGERGRERIFLPQGAQVVPNHQLSAGNGAIQLVGKLRGRDIYLANAGETQTRRRI